jgi:hypothetical protein
MPQPDEQLPEQFARLGFNYQDLAPRIRDIDPTLAECSIQFSDPRTANPGEFFQFSFEFWREKREDPTTITCLSAALIGPGPNSQEELLANEYYHTALQPIPPKEEVIAKLLDLQRRQRASQKFNLDGKLSKQRRRHKPPPRR